MSSMRNSLHRRNHKERSQLAHRSRLGFLEKHKDYVLRAKDYHSKQDRIRKLKQKAEDRNKDEFYFGMNRERTKGGVHVKDRGNVALPIDIVKVLKTQDENYIRTARAAGLRKIDQLKAQLMTMANLLPSGAPEGVHYENDLTEEDMTLLSEAGLLKGKSSQVLRKRAKGHLIFADDEEAARQYLQKDGESSHDGGMQEEEFDLGWKKPTVEKSRRKRRKSKSAAEGEGSPMDEDVAGVDSDSVETRSSLLKELAARLARDKQLRYAARELEMQRLLMGKGAARKLRGVERVEGDDQGDDDEDEDDLPKGRGRGKDQVVDEKTYKPRVYKWRAERKR